MMRFRPTLGCEYPRLQMLMLCYLLVPCLILYAFVFLDSMFAMQTRDKPIDIQTLELDLRLSGASDLRIEVYTSTAGNFQLTVNNEYAWELVANTSVVPIPGGGGGLIPATDFTPVSMAAGERRSFYITMHGPYIDHTVNALDKIGELAFSTEDFNIYTGAGLTEYKFPSEIDTLVQPKFAGVVHYTIPSSCVERQLVTTSVDYKFLVEASANEVLPTITEIIDTFTATLLVEDPVLALLEVEHDLRKQGTPISLESSTFCRFLIAASAVIYTM